MNGKFERVVGILSLYLRARFIVAINSSLGETKSHCWKHLIHYDYDVYRLAVGLADSLCIVVFSIQFSLMAN